MLFLPHVDMADQSSIGLATGTPSTSYGTQGTGGTVAHTKAATWTQLHAGVPYDVYRVLIAISDTFVAATDTRTLVDIGVGASGSEQVLIPNMLAGHCNTISNMEGAMGRFVDLPLYIPRGTRISMRAQSVTVSKTYRVFMALWGGPSLPPWPVFRGCDAYGPDTATSGGVAHTPGNTGVQSAWASVGSVTTRPYSAFFPMVAGAAAVTIYNVIAYQLQWGWSSTALMEGWCRSGTSEQFTGPFPTGPIYTDIPAGTQLQVRGKASGTAQSLNTAIYCLY